ncbi:MAG TPA: DNA polymerase III subunit chi [Stellaceae bacterium]|nr:DNA polymerase III subunit chi [Stellaceae bacterium]
MGFYHLKVTPLERALPRLLERALKDGYRIQIVAGSSERVEHLNQLLWTYEEASFLPHGSARDGNAERQPIFLTADEGNPNAATMLVLVDGARVTALEEYRRVCDMFDGNDETAVEDARRRWREAKLAGHTLTYWEQTGAGWVKRAADSDSSGPDSSGAG